MFAVGDEVRVIDQKPHVDGVVTEVSTRKQVNGGPSEKTCYKVRCDRWPSEHWLDASGVALRADDPVV